MFRLSALYRYPIKSSAAESLERVALDARWAWSATDAGWRWTPKPDVSSRLLPGGVSRRAGGAGVLRLNAPGMSG